MPRCGNPRWVRWLEEERQSVIEKQPENPREKGLLQAIRSLQKEKAQYAHPDQLRGTVKYFGPGTIAILVGRMKKHCQEHGRPMPVADAPILAGYGSDSGADNDEPPPAKRAKTGAAKPKGKGRATIDYDDDSDDQRDDAVPPARKSGKRTAPAPAVRYDDDSSDPEGQYGRANGRGRPKKKKKAGEEGGGSPKRYKPNKGKGPYAILVAFVKAANEKGAATHWLTKEEIIQLAEPHTDSSFHEKRGGPASGNWGFTAWDGRKVLLEKGMISQKGRAPIRYRITEAGLKVANVCAEEEDLPTFDGMAPGTDPPARPPSKKPEDMWDSEGGDDAEVGLAAALAASRAPPAPTTRAPTDRRATGFLAANGSNARIFAHEEVTKRSHTDPGPGSGSPKSNFVFSYLTPTDCRTNIRALADTNIDPDDFSETFKIEYYKSQGEHDFARAHVLQGAGTHFAVVQQKGTNTKTQGGWLRHARAPERAPGLDTAVAPPAHIPTKTNIDARSAAVAAAQRRAEDMRNALMGSEARGEAVDKNAMYKPPSGTRKVGAASSAAGVPPVDSVSRPLIRQTSHPVAGPSKERVQPAYGQAHIVNEPIAGPSKSRGGPLAGPSRLPSVSQVDNEPPQIPLQRSSTSAMTFDPLFLSGAAAVNVLNGTVLPNFDMRDAIVMRPGEFKVHLAVDHRERGILSAVKQRDVNAYEEALELGDFIWVARRNVPSARPEEDALVLDGILERKRFDDLISSIRDKRYDEQKIRIKKSGTTRRMYMIQMYEQKRHVGWEQQYWTVSSQSQVSDGFTLAQVQSPAEAADHVTRITQVMAQIHESATVYGIPDRFVARNSYLALQADLRKRHPTTPFLITFRAFQDINKKQHNVKSGWANMLMSQIGLGPEKVCDVVDRWPTPAAFRKDLKRQIQAQEGEQSEPSAVGKAKKKRHAGEAWLQDQVGHDGTRGIKEKLSRYLYHLFAAEDYAAIDLDKK